MAQWVKNPPVMQETQEMQVWSLGWVDLLEKKVAAHSSLLAWEIPWTEDPGRLQSVGSQRVDATEGPEHADLGKQQLAPRLLLTASPCSHHPFLP